MSDAEKKFGYKAVAYIIGIGIAVFAVTRTINVLVYSDDEKPATPPVALTAETKLTVDDFAKMVNDTDQKVVIDDTITQISRTAQGSNVTFVFEVSSAVEEFDKIDKETLRKNFSETQKTNPWCQMQNVRDLGISFNFVFRHKTEDKELSFTETLDNLCSGK